MTLAVERESHLLQIRTEKKEDKAIVRVVNAGFDACVKIGVGTVVVIGYPEYYLRFGFLPSSRFGIGSEYDAPEDVFMVKELQRGYLREATGIIKYHAAFGNV